MDTFLQVFHFLVIFVVARAISELMVRLQLPTILGDVAMASLAVLTFCWLGVQVIGLEAALGAFSAGLTSVPRSTLTTSKPWSSRPGGTVRHGALRVDRYRY